MDDAELQEHRRAALARWVKARGGLMRAIEGRAIPDSYRSFLSAVLNGYAFGSKAARTCEQRLGMPSLYLERAARRVPAAAARPSLAEALAVLGEALAGDLADDVRDDLVDALGKLARRGGTARDQAQVLALLTKG